MATFLEALQEQQKKYQEERDKHKTVSRKTLRLDAKISATKAGISVLSNEPGTEFIRVGLPVKRFEPGDARSAVEAIEYSLSNSGLSDEKYSIVGGHYKHAHSLRRIIDQVKKQLPEATRPSHTTGAANLYSGPGAWQATAATLRQTRSPGADPAASA